MIDFFEFSNEMLCVADERGYFTRVNQAWTATLGWSVEELTSRPYIDFVHPEDLEPTIREANLLLSDGREVIRFENRYRCRNGSYRWLAWQARGEAGAHQIIAAARDVTEEKLQAEALRESEERFRTLANHAPVGIAQADAEGSVYFVNDKWCELSGIRSEDALGFAWKVSIHPDDLDMEIERWQKALQSRQDMPPHELRFMHVNGDIRWALSSVALVKGRQGEVVGHIATVEDITERKEAELALRESEERFRAFMDNGPAIAWSKDEQGRIVFLNKTCEQHFRLEFDDWFGKTDFDFWPPEIAKRLQENDRKVLETGLPLKTIEETFSPDRPHNYWMTTLFPYQDGLGRTYVGGISTDITELKTAHEAMKKQETVLRNLIGVQESEKQFLCQEFHDGLIQYAVGSLMSLEGFQSKNPATDASGVIDAVVGNLRKGVEDGRRAIRGIRPAVLDDSNLEAAINDLIDQFASSDIMVTLDCDPEIGRLPNSIQTTVYRVVQEALNNARKHSGTDVIRVALQKSDGELHLEVWDFGCGFDVKSTRTGAFGLLGMSERVRLLGGNCSVLSEKDAGTRIAVRLPIASQDESDGRRQPTAAANCSPDLK
jgi:PAS domain S-box-containing protein